MLYLPTDDDIINAYHYGNLDDLFHGDENIVEKKNRHADIQYCDKCKHWRLDNYDGYMDVDMMDMVISVKRAFTLHKYDK